MTLTYIDSTFPQVCWYLQSCRIFNIHHILAAIVDSVPLPQDINNVRLCKLSLAQLGYGRLSKLWLFLACLNFGVLMILGPGHIFDNPSYPESKEQTSSCLQHGNLVRCRRVKSIVALQCRNSVLYIGQNLEFEFSLPLISGGRVSDRL